ncbi:hypothetical protein PV05_08202 [Exophiala xenobiotica]|uniref:Enoyl reductase (ER) domain-containing protein n=1 Tax=Exophiala xenobiotica TaxID=348802 RepID=A0A0D2CRH6_9EURO|nr:uncharacterized protein PV05_08202 [Exophiala xenobiotica]KIW52572.1 hypothetical protein PV05_08202 [Exophiala xenobiotica]
MPTDIEHVSITTFGGPEVVKVTHSSLPDPPLKHVQIKVLYSGFAGSDINMRMGTYPMQKKAPLTPGYCCVGTVHANGPGANKFKVGDQVACLTVYDSEATYTNQPEKYLVPVPAGLDPKSATALVLDWNTAYGMTKGKLSAGDKVFVHGMSGAVGYALMSLAKAAGAEVYGTASARNHQAIRDLGATPFEYRNKDWIQAMKDMGGVQAVYDPLGFESWDESYSILSMKGGVLYGYGGNLASLNGTEQRSTVWPTVKLLAKNLKLCDRRTVFHYISRDQGSFEPNLKELFGMALEGKINVSIKRVLALDDVPTAHKEWTSMTGMGSVVVEIA